MKKIFDISTIKRIQFRADINGLRATAVLSIVFYHADINFFKGGWLGVDIFFVVSGYLISNVIFIDSTQLFCNSYILDTCISALKDKLYYFDTHHLTVEGGELITNKIYKTVEDLTK